MTGFYENYDDAEGVHKGSAEQSALEAAASATAAASSATSAETSATSSSTKAGEAATSASTATTKASEAATSASTATTKASESATSAAASDTSATESATSATASESSRQASASAAAVAVSAYGSAFNSATASAASATAAAGSESAVAASATAAAGSATTASTSASNAATSESNAATSATEAAASATLANSAEVVTVAGIAADVTAVAGIDGNVTSVAGIASDVTTVAAEPLKTNIATVAATPLSTNINIVGPAASSVTTVAGDIAKVNTVASDLSGSDTIGTVAGIATDVTTVSGISADVTTVAGITAGDISLVAAVDDKVTQVAAINNEVSVVGSEPYKTKVETVAESVYKGKVETVSGLTSEVTAVANIASDVTTVSDNITDVQNAEENATIATNKAAESAASAVTSAASASTSASSAAASASSATAAASSESNAATSETNAAASATDSSTAASTWNSYYNTYVGASSSAPTVDVQGNALVAGALYFNTTNNTTYVWTGSAWNAVANNNIINPNVALTQDLATNGNDVKFGDNDKATFGASDDLQIYHDGSNSYIEDSGTGRLNVKANVFRVYNAAGNEISANFVQNGAVELYYDSAGKLATTATGIDVTGTATMDGLVVDGNGEISGILPRLILNETDTTDLNAAIRNNAGVFRVQTVNDAANTFTKRIDLDHATGDISFYEDTGTTPKLFWDASAESLGIGTSAPERKLHINSGGVQIGALIQSASAVSARLALMDANTSSSSQVGTGATGNNLGLYAGGASRVTVDSSGNVGINNSSPQTVHGETSVDGEASAGFEYIAGRTTTTTGVGQFLGGFAIRNSDSNAAPDHYSGIIGRAGDTFGSANLEFYSGRDRYEAGTAPNMIILGNTGTTDGRVGIGTSSPASLMHLKIAGTTGSNILSLENDSNKYDFRLAGANLILRDGSIDRVTLDSSGNVGIGTTSPSHPLTIQGSGTSGNAIKIIGDSTNDSGRILWRNNGDTSVTASIDVNSSEDMVFGTGGSTERMRIDSSGNLLVGKTSTSSALTTAGVDLRPEGRSFMTRSAGPALYLSRTTSDGNIAEFYKDGTTVGSIGNATGTLVVGSPDGSGSYLRFGSNNINPTTSAGALRDAAIDLGKTGGRFKDLYLSGGVYLGGTGAANKLEDYEKGSFTPQIGDVSGNTGTLTTALGYYTKVGRQVTIVVDMINMDTTALVSTEQFRIKNLPFSAFTASGGPTFTSIAQVHNIGASGKTIIASIQDQFGYVRLKEADSGLSDYLLVSDIGQSSLADIRFSLTYFTA